MNKTIEVRGNKVFVESREVIIFGSQPYPVTYPHSHPVTCICRSDDERTLVTGDAGGALRVWNITVDEPRCIWKPLDNVSMHPLDDVAISDDRTTLVARQGRHIFVWKSDGNVVPGSGGWVMEWRFNAFIKGEEQTGIREFGEQISVDFNHPFPVILLLRSVAKEWMPAA